MGPSAPQCPPFPQATSSGRMPLVIPHVSPPGLLMAVLAIEPMLLLPGPGI